MRRKLFALALCLSIARMSFAQASSPAPAITAAAEQPAKKSLRVADVAYVPTPPLVVEAMLKGARVGKRDVVYDLGSGDGRIVIAAVKDFGAVRAVGIDIDPARVMEANANAQKAGVSDRVRFLNEDIFEADFRDATVVTLYLHPAVNRKLLPKLLATLAPGTRIVSHSHGIGDWKPERTRIVSGKKIHFWTIPARNAAP